jgi:uncharacterized Zn-finger protein
MTVTHRTDAQDDSLGNANTQTRVEVSLAELPLSCPQPSEKIWNAHPRVYLAIEESGEASCPYCGTHYVLTQQ